MQRELNYGPRLTDEEYEKKIIELHRGLPPMPTKSLDREVRRRELELAIDHRLGRDFPKERREALWAAKERVERKRLWLGVKFLIKKKLGGSVVKDAQGLAGYMVDEYAKVLNAAELESFLDLKKGERPALPVGLDELEK